MKKTKLNIGDKVEYTKTYMFGKQDIVTAKVVMKKGNKILLDNGDEFYHFFNKSFLPINK